MLSFNPLKSKTFWGTAAVVAGWMSSLPVLDIKHAVMGLGGLLAALGLRDAATKTS